MEYAFLSSKSWSEGLFFQVLHHKSTLLLELERASDRGDVVVGPVSLILAWPYAFSVLSYSLTGLISRFWVTHSISVGSPAIYQFKSGTIRLGLHARSVLVWWSCFS